ncbi:MAG: HesA/MoeB/ThiF family protein [Muribaculaceae bacterium]|nr:HesA/MoeB/ThiF family protein [Muribaculaceae bacterium]MDE6321854.1 HesA/MoeB/ThiF family protein [Muribaculaceae bacterium]
MDGKKLSKDYLNRYKGHISLCEIDLQGQRAITQGRVLIVGAGGLGSPVALYLAAAGVGHIGIIDADTVSLSNLQRQIIHGTPDIGSPKVQSAKNQMLRINPEVEVQVYEQFVTEENARELFDGYDLVMDCTDNFDTRLLISDTCVAMGLPYVFGGVTRFGGQVFTHLPGTSDLTTYFGRKGAEVTEPCVITGILNTVVGVVGSLQATEAIKYLTRTGDLLTDRILTFDAITMTFETFAVEK